VVIVNDIRTVPQSANVDAVPEPPSGLRSPYLVLAIVLSATFVQLLDASIVSIAIPPIQADLNASYAELELMVGGYLLTFACALLVGGRLGDVYGRKRLFLIGMAGFTAASAMCGFAPGPTTLVVARLLQGLSSGLMFPQVLSVIQVTFPPDRRHRAYGIYGTTLGVASILGPLLGGLLIEADLFGTGWRMIFLVNLPVGLAALGLGLALLPESRAQHIRRVDPVGAVLATSGLFLVVLPLTIGRDHGWPWWTYLMLAAGLAILVGFALHQRERSRRGATPLVPWPLFGQRSFTVGLLVNLIFFLGVAPFFFYFIIYLEIGPGFSPLDAGLITLPVAIAAAIASIASDRLAGRLGRGGLVAGTLLLIAGMTLLVVTLHGAHGDRPAWSFVPALVLAGTGLGLFVALVVAVVLAGIRPDDAGAASGALATVQQAGGAVGIAVVGVIFFGLIAANADRAVDAQVTTLDRALAAAGVPAPARTGMVGQFQTCFHDRTQQKDLSATPPSCRQAQRQAATALASAPPETGAAVERAMSTAAQRGLDRDVTLAAERTTWYEVAVFAGALVLVLALPRIDPARLRTHPPAAA
jgi:EmrB/QacA subfamily drug resistance transporter